MVFFTELSNLNFSVLNTYIYTLKDNASANDNTFKHFNVLMGVLYA